VKATLWRRSLRLGFLALTLAAPALAQGEEPNDDLYQAVARGLTMLFILAVLLENAFATIFNWRLFLTYFSVRGVKTIVMIAVSLVIVLLFEIDIVDDLVEAYHPDTVDINAGVLSIPITALILAGGSSAVNNVMRALGLRERTEEPVVTPPPDNRAFVAVWVKRKEAVGEILVQVRDLGPAANPATDPIPIAGVVGARLPSPAQVLLRNRDRFPPNGGYTLTSNVIYEFAVEGRKADGTVVTVAALQGRKFVFASRAIVDIEVTL
jgi:hypothetical protein